MARRVARDMTVEEFDDWSKAKARFKAVADAADEEGGPTLSLVPAKDHNDAWPTDLLPPAPQSPDPQSPDDAAIADGQSDHPAASEPAVPAMPFDGVELPESRKRLAGWSAERQRLFLSTLAETGSVHVASNDARLSSRGAYRLRTRSPAFAKAWDTALQLSVGRLSAIVFDRAINGRIEQVYQGGELVAERRVPSDKLLTWLLARLDPKRFALPWEQRGDADPQVEAVESFPKLLDDLGDVPTD